MGSPGAKPLNLFPPYGCHFWTNKFHQNITSKWFNFDCILWFFSLRAFWTKVIHLCSKTHTYCGFFVASLDHLWAHWGRILGPTGGLQFGVIFLRYFAPTFWCLWGSVWKNDICLGWVRTFSKHFGVCGRCSTWDMICKCHRTRSQTGIQNSWIDTFWNYAGRFVFFEPKTPPQIAFFPLRAKVPPKTNN